MGKVTHRIFRHRFYRKFFVSTCFLIVFFIVFSVPLSVKSIDITCFQQADCDIQGCLGTLDCLDIHPGCMPVCELDGKRCPTFAWCSDEPTYQCGYEDIAAPTADISYSGDWNNSAFSVTLTATDPSSDYWVLVT